ncbi:MAG: NAD(P)H-dependent glycerol-3-phosphate dehydrogenase [bacterium]|nr:NAD(P)H-dependent glycerol-3-phosphate dehydrogenase [bacterium]
MKFPEKISKITVLGGGSWGTAMAVLLAEKGLPVTLWEYLRENVLLLQKDRENKKYLPGIKIPQSVQITDNLDEAMKNSEIVLVVLPSHTIRSHMQKIARMKIDPYAFVILSKGLENDTFFRMSEVVKDCLGEGYGRKIITLSGPSHAEEVSLKFPTAVVIAGEDKYILENIQQVFGNDYFRIYTNPDQIGVELGAALKNIIAIACGISDGLGYGDNTRAGIITRGLAEISRFMAARGAAPYTFMGLSGLGDLVVTCTSRHSRNRRLGELIGQGNTLSQALDKMIMIAEGVKTAKSAFDLSQKNKIDMPITTEVYKVLFENQSPFDAVNNLLKRKQKSEIGG